MLSLTLFMQTVLMTQLQQHMGQMHLGGGGHLGVPPTPLAMRPQDPYPQLDYQYQGGFPGMLPAPHQGLLQPPGGLGNMYYGGPQGL